MFSDQYYYVKLGHAKIHMPGVNLSAENFPVLLEFLNSGNIKLTIIFVELPRDFETILKRGEDQSAAVVEPNQFSLFSLRIDRLKSQPEAVVRSWLDVDHYVTLLVH